MKPKFSLAPLVYVTLLMVPVYWLLVISVKSIAEISGEITLFPHAPTAENYQFIFDDASLYNGYVNATIYVLMNVVISVVVAIPAAYGFSRYRFRGDRVLFFGFLAFRMMAPAVLLVPFVEIFSQLGLIDTHIAVALAHCFFNVPLAIWILEGFISVNSARDGRYCQGRWLWFYPVFPAHIAASNRARNSRCCFLLLPIFMD